MRLNDRRWKCAATIGLVAIASLGSTGCLVGREFRQAATDDVHAGVSLIVGALIDGVFAAIEPDPPTSGNT